MTISGPNDINSSSPLSDLSSASDLLNSESKSKNIIGVLLKESDNHSNDSNTKSEKAKEYIQASEKLRKLASAVREKAAKLKGSKIEEEERQKISKEIIAQIPDALKIYFPTDASPEVLEKIADELDERAKDLRVKADDLLKDSEKSQELAKNLKDQAGQMAKKDLKLSDLHLKHVSAHNQGLLKVLQKLGIAKLDAEYKQQVESSQRNGVG